MKTTTTVSVSLEAHDALRLASINTRRKVSDLASESIESHCGKINERAAKKAAKSPAKPKP